ncbi:hypothetical protein [Bradyrhizobium diversitatis]|uniref:Glycosyltransferase RgtA/B/C/D-like domain-containing protein n=1 Tax=Bradyrhizobium diversitatis TaxID=2755406 RepID=A0ABS0PA02_9BRAD|nr:hypothetical protein [Bradyrhizobium diversitatis]MBH5390140.1 hypothetical protein [Bradyrhizobium diversitatis]
MNVDPRAAALRQAERAGIGYVYVALVLAFVTAVPALFAREVFGDDWTVYYIYWTQGAAGVARVLWESAHAGFAIPMTLFVTLLNDTPDVSARLAGLACHLVNGVLLHSVLSRSSYTRRIAGLVTALFLLSPFYAIRLTLNAVYDFFLLFYLLSYAFTYSKVRALRWAAPFALFFSLSLEILIALEPLRIMLTWSSREPWRRRLARLAPFWLVTAAVIMLRLTILGKSGHYAGQYSFVHDLTVIGNALHEHLAAFPKGLSYAASQGIALLGDFVWTLLTLAAMAGFALLSSRAFWTPWVLEGHGSIRRVLALLLSGTAIAILGAMPFALTGTYGDVTRGESRLLFASQLGILILAATVIQIMPTSRLRAAIAGGLIAVFTVAMAQDSKWLLYDGLINADLQRQVRAALLADPEPKVVKLQIENSTIISFRSRCLGASDMNVAQMMLRDENRERSYVYTDYCGDFQNRDLVPSGNCTVSYLEFFRCPPRREIWRYRAAPGIPLPNDIRFVELMKAVLEDAPSATQGRGELMQLKDDLPTPLARGEYRPPCRRPGVRGSAWLLALPTPACEDSASGAR